MAILVTRPAPENVATAEALRARGFEALLAPLMKFEPLAFNGDGEQQYDAVIVTSANAIRAAASQLSDKRLLKLPLFAVGEQTAEIAGRAGFETVITASGDAAALRDCVLQRLRDKSLKKGAALLYLAGADLSHDLAGDLEAAGFKVATHTVYRMVQLAGLPREVCQGLANHDIEAVLHYSRRSARAFLEAARGEGVEISALAIPHCCLSENVAAVFREAGASQVAVAASPDQNALLDALGRALRARLA